jgi:hypothetical protein
MSVIDGLRVFEEFKVNRVLIVVKVDCRGSVD